MSDGKLFVLCPVCHGARHRPSSRGPIDCGTCGGAGTLEIPAIRRDLPVLPKRAEMMGEAR